MSALEKFSVSPHPARHALRAVVRADPAAGAGTGPFAVLIRLAGRLLPGAVFVLDRPEHPAGLQTWPSGMMGRRTSIDVLARVLLDRSASGGEVWIGSLTDHPDYRSVPEVRDAGPLGFARLALQDGSFSVIREAREWSDEERATVRDVVAAAEAECERLRLVEQAEEMAHRARELQQRSPDRMASVAPLLSGVCHELNNPLTSIKSFAELLLMDARSDDDREALEIVLREAQRAARIVGDLRLVARRSAEAAMRRDLMNLNEVVRDDLHARAGELRLEGVETRLELVADLPPVRAVRAHLEQVVSHLISRAVRAMQPVDGVRLLTVSTSRCADGVAMTVRDSGPGIPPEDLARVFDPFWTSQGTGDGPGLGLSLVESIVVNHGGRVTADSRLGHGSVFTVHLPPADDMPPEVVTSDEPPASRGLRVLVVDDEAPIRYSLARYMERRGHEVHQAGDGYAALKMVDAAPESEGYDIVIADMRMPGLCGEGLLAGLRERPDGLDQRLIFMTGDVQAPGAARLVQDSGIPVMWKPFELAEVAQIIEAQARLLAE